MQRYRPDHPLLEGQVAQHHQYHQQRQYQDQQHLARTHEDLPRQLQQTQHVQDAGRHIVDPNQYNAPHLTARHPPLQRRELSPNYTVNPATGTRTSPRRLTGVHSQTHARSAGATQRLPSITPLLRQVAPFTVQRHGQVREREAHTGARLQHVDDGIEVAPPLPNGFEEGERVAHRQRERVIDAINTRAEEEEDEDGEDRREEEEMSSDGEFPGGKELLHAVEAENRTVEGTSKQVSRGGRGGGRGGRGRGQGGRGGGAMGRRGDVKATGKAAEAKTRTKRGGKGSRSGTNRREAGASDEEIGELDIKEAKSVIEASEATHWAIEETLSMVRYICDERRFKTFKATRGHVMQEVCT